MKHVVKGAPPPEFEAWKNQANEDWMPAYHLLRNPEKEILHRALLSEQGWVCCYCGRGVSLGDSHIEHFRPQENWPQLALDHANLFASCIRERKPGAPLHCGHAKGSDFDVTRHIDPLDRACEQRFIHTLAGAIIPSDAEDIAAAYMIDLLQLDLPLLRIGRAAVLASVFDPAFLDTATDEELRRLAAAYRAKDREGRLEGFGHVAARFAEQQLKPGL